MARYTGAVCKLCRREHQKLFLKGEKCYSAKCPIAQNRGIPGQHGARRHKLTEYGVQLREKQKAKRFYGVLEKQFAHYYELASKKTGVTGDNLMQILETRLDNVVYRLGFAVSRAEARQLIIHGHFTVNGAKVDIPSYLIKEGDVIAIKEKSKDSVKIKAILESTESKPLPKWLECDRANNAYVGKVVALPTIEDVDLPLEVHLIVELYSK